MDELERRLKEDAAQIPADVSAELSARIDASLRAADRVRSGRRTFPRGFSMWWISSLTGVTAAFLVISVLNRNATDSVERPPDSPIVSVVPDYRLRTQSEFPLRAETAELTEPLQDELEKLRLDFEKAREDLEEDLRQSF